MADHNGEIITGIAALGTFIGAALAAIGLRRKPEPPAEQPENGTSKMADRLQAIELAIAEHHTRLDRIEVDRRETRETLNSIFDEIQKTRDFFALTE